MAEERDINGWKVEDCYILERIQRYQERFYTPEMFWGVDGHIICLPPDE